MANWTISNAATVPLNEKAGTVPDVSGGLRNWFQPMVFSRIVKTTIGFQVVETEINTEFRGVLQPLTERQLLLKPEGERAWTWLTLHADPVLKLNVDEIVKYLGKQTRVMARKDYTLYGYVEYQLVQDWTGSSPEVIVNVYDGGNAFPFTYVLFLDGGNAFVTGPSTADGGIAFGVL